MENVAIINAEWSEDKNMEMPPTMQRLIRRSVEQMISKETVLGKVEQTGLRRRVQEKME